MRFEILQPGGQPHVVEFEGRLVTLGRDPGCDLVLNDIKCSRRHAVLESGPDGLLIRDTASSNGVYVNGEKLERARLVRGDEIGLGDVVLRVLDPTQQGSGSVGAGDRETGPSWNGVDGVGGPRPLPPVLGTTSEQERPLDPAPPGRAQHGPSSGAERAITLDVLVGLWLLSALVSGVGGALLAVFLRRSLAWSITIAAAAVVTTLLSAALAFGLAKRRPWARWLQVVVAAAGLLNCPFTLASALVLVYMLRGETAARFALAAGRPPDGRPTDRSSEIVFAVALAALTLFGCLLCGLAIWLSRGTPARI